MKAFRFVLLTSASLLLFGTSICAQDSPPKAAIHGVTDTYFGMKIVDPYRWMEDARSPESAAWMRGQADYTRAYLDRLHMRAQLLKRVEEFGEPGLRVAGVERA